MSKLPEAISPSEAEESDKFRFLQHFIRRRTSRASRRKMEARDGSWRLVGLATFDVKMSEIVTGKAACHNCRKRIKAYVEDSFGPPTQPGAISPVFARDPFPFLYSHTDILPHKYDTQHTSCNR